MRRLHIEEHSVWWRVPSSELGYVLALEQVCEVGEGREGRRPFLLTTPRWFTRHVSHQIPLVLIVVTVETQQFPIASVRRIVVMIVVLVMDRELVHLLAVKLATTVRTDPWEEFECKDSIRLLTMRGGTPCHESLRVIGNSARVYSTPDLRLTHAMHVLLNWGH